MIGFVRGVVSDLYVDHCLIDVTGLGYRVYIPESSRRELKVGAVALLYTYLHVREDALLLYGFISNEEYQLFINLTSVNGIGPKVALGIVSAISPREFIKAVGQKNIEILTKLPGVGRKTAERIVLELKDKIGLADSQDGMDDSYNPENQPASAADEAIAALIALGYSQSEIMPAINKYKNQTSVVEELIKLSLKELCRR